MTHNQTTPIRKLTLIHQAPAPHWVGDGFHVQTLFSHMRQEQQSDPFLMLDYAAPKDYPPNRGSAKGVDQHPHKGFETVTIALQGEVAHRDSSGSGGIIGEGDVQWMTAGSGIIHEEFHSENFSQKGGRFEMVQLWVNLPAKAKSTPPNYQHLAKAYIPTATLYDENGATVGTARIIAGKMGDTRGIAKTHTELNLWELDLHAEKTTTLTIPDNHTLLLVVLRGNPKINDHPNPASPAELITFTPPTHSESQSRVIIRAGATSAKLLLLSGMPIGERVVGYGPFVMNSEEEIHAAIKDYRSGKFGTIA